MDLHLATFQEHARLRAGRTEPQPLGGWLHPALISSVQRFQAGEDGDGASLIAAAERAGDPVYHEAVKLFVAEEQSHAVRLANVLRYAGAGTIGGHWTDTVFVLVRRAGGLRLELLTLMLAEVVALRYYRALRDGTGDDYVGDVAGRILADEERHVPFHIDRLRQGFAGTPAAGRAVAAAGWWVLMVGAAGVVAADHGSALRVLGVSRRHFIRDVLRLFRPMVTSVFGRDRGTAVTAPRSPAATTAARP
ncbi:MAG TPA: ferritin-like domain-containing protein [Actinoplanes sp.]|nr:ferritin-like domain-containing protein [Actinoplanes sp.]